MTLEELKIEADKLGYRLVKKKPYVKHEKCSCGKRGRLWFVPHKGCLVRCDTCGRAGSVGDSEDEAWRNWNFDLKYPEDDNRLNVEGD